MPVRHRTGPDVNQSTRLARKPGVEFAGEIRTRRLQNLIRPPQLPVFPLQLRDPLLVLTRDAGAHPIVDLGLLDPAPQRLGVNTQLTTHPGQLTVPLALSLPDLQDHLHRAFAQLIGVLPLCRHDSASFQGSEPPRSPGRSKARVRWSTRTGPIAG